MKKGIVIFVIGMVFGTAAGFALGIFVYPYVFLADIVASEKVDDPSGRKAVAAGVFVYPYIFLADIVAADKVDDKAARKIVATGMFIHANPGDPIHYGKGKVTAYQDLVHLEATSR